MANHSSGHLYVEVSLHVSLVKWSGLMETGLDVQLILSCKANLHCVLLLMYIFLCCVCKLVYTCFVIDV